MSATLNKDLDEARLELAKAQAQKKRELKKLEVGRGGVGARVGAALGVGAVQQHAGANFVSVEASEEYAKQKEAQRAARSPRIARNGSGQRKIKGGGGRAKKKEKKQGWFGAKKKKKKKPLPGPTVLMTDVAGGLRATYLRIENTAAER